MFSRVAGYRVILVSGPQRSGTTITARMIAHDTRLRYVDEEEFAVHDFDLLREIVCRERGVVVHCPALAHRVHELAGEDVLVVFVWRRWADIVASQKRIGWDEEEVERAKYGDFVRPGEGSVAVKYRYWREVQQERCPHSMDVFYEGLAGHPLWEKLARRRGWMARQWHG